MAKQEKKPQRTRDEMERIRNTAEDMYITVGLTGREIAELFDVSEQTVSTWKKGRDGEQSWDDRKRVLQLTPTRLKELIMREAEKEINGKDEDEKSKVNADRLIKLVSAIDKLDKRVNPRVAMSVFQMFDNFMADTNPEKAVEFTDYHKQFLQYLIASEF